MKQFTLIDTENKPKMALSLFEGENWLIKKKIGIIALLKNKTYKGALKEGEKISRKMGYQLGI